MPASTFPALLAERLRHDPGAPLVTYYDDATGERTELSVTSYANWAAKHANLWLEELELEPGDATVLVDLPSHWLVPTLLGGAWLAGVAVTTDPSVPHDVAVVTAGAAAAYDGAGVPVLASALHPFGLPSAEPLPAGVLDHGHLWPGQSDAFVPIVPAEPGTVAWRDADGTATTQRTLLDEAAAVAGGPGARVLTTAHPADGRGVPELLAPLLTGSVVYVSHPDAGHWEDRLRQERVDRVQGPTPGR